MHMQIATTISGTSSSSSCSTPTVCCSSLIRLGQCTRTTTRFSTAGKKTKRHVPLRLQVGWFNFIAGIDEAAMSAKERIKGTESAGVAKTIQRQGLRQISLTACIWS